jgi:hypothetical protein
MTYEVYFLGIMDELLNEIRVVYPDAEINSVLADIPDAAQGTSCLVRYNHSEELFLELGADLTMPRFPIHHDVHMEAPSAPYAYALKNLVKQLVQLLPEVFHGMTYYFDPSEPLKPRFYRLYKVENFVYLYILRIDIVFRHSQGDVVEPGTNDVTPAFKTRRLFIESEFIPLEAVMWELGKARAFKVKQLISNTWIGETGRGYLLHGIWMDNDLSKFFSKLVLPEGARTYPHFPFFCKYKTICAEVVPPEPGRRKRLLPLLHRIVTFLAPEIETIQACLKASSFSDTLPEFIELRSRVPSSWKETFKGISVRSYLNDRDQKEYALEIDDSGN